MRTPLALYLLALVGRLVLIALHPDPAYPDSFYYADVARSLVAGHGFSVDFVWIFAEVGGKIPALPILPIPSNAHWMPLASLVQVPFIAALGPTAVASALPFALIGAVLAPQRSLAASAKQAGTDRGAATTVAQKLVLKYEASQPTGWEQPYTPTLGGHTRRRRSTIGVRHIASACSRSARQELLPTLSLRAPRRTPTSSSRRHSIRHGVVITHLSTSAG